MTSPIDTIASNDSIVAAFQQSRGYDYAQELEPEQSGNYFERFLNYLQDLLNIGDLTLSSIPMWLWWSMGAVVLVALGYLFWKHRGRLFAPDDEEPKAEEITEDDINEVDFDLLIAEAQKNGDYLMLCRLRYLQTLKAASDASLVTWRRYKTPSQYAQEWQDDDFVAMTNHFLRIRYGHYAADAALAQEMHSRQDAALERIAGTAVEPVHIDHQQEGGTPS